MDMPEGGDVEAGVVGCLPRHPVSVELPAEADDGVGVPGRYESVSQVVVGAIVISGDDVVQVRGRQGGVRCEDTEGEGHRYDDDGPVRSVISPRPGLDEMTPCARSEVGVT